ncbi:MAG TPA: hypothetical protein VM123_08065 [archaeon]|nr:hypothetical protein [archaeon]
MIFYNYVVLWITKNAIWLTPIVALFAAFYAVYRDSILAWKRRPKLSVEFNFIPPDCQKEIINNSIDSYYFRIRVKNEGKTEADRVEVMIYNLRDNADKKVPNFLPMNLKWTHRDFEQPNQKITMDCIPQGMEKLCDIGKIIDPKERNRLPNENEKSTRFEENKTIFSFEVYPKPNSLFHLIPKGRYNFNLKIGASNCKSIDAIIEIDFNGEWSYEENKMLKKNISIRLLKSEKKIFS